MPDLLLVFINAVVSFAYLFIVSQLLGKKQLAELTFCDYVIGISLGSIAAEWSTDADNPWYFYAIAILVYFVLSAIIDAVERTLPFFKTILKGRPLVIIEDGKFNYENLKKSKLDVNDVLGLMRNQGYFDPGDIAYALFETNGQLSLMPKGSEKPTVVSDFDIPFEKASPTNYAVIDGRIYYPALKEMNITENELMEQLDVKSKYGLKNILLAYYNDERKEFVIHRKYDSAENGGGN